MPHTDDGRRIWPPDDDPEEWTEVVPTAHTAKEVEAEPDVVSDPALDDRIGSDWVDEGGALPDEPAEPSQKLQTGLDWQDN